EDSPAAADPSLQHSRIVFVYCLLFPEEVAAVVKMFWQHAGENISSRFAEYCLKVGGGNKQSVGYFQSVATASTDRFQTPGYRLSDQGSQHVQQANGAESCASELFVEERFGRNLDLKLAGDAKMLLRQRIAGTLADGGDSSDEGDRKPVVVNSESARELHGVNESHVLLFPTGMSAIYNAFRIVQRLKPGLKTVQFGFPYTDTLKIQQKFGSGCIFLGHGTNSDLDDLERLLEAGERIGALFCEFPSNPLLK
ncbi:hypothetical protein HDU98_006131, partial [Podochytrium sp. JEL0797]